MELYVLDFETYYDKDYTLSNMTTEQYIRDPRFETIGVGVVCPRTGHRKWFEHHEFVKAAQRVNWAEVAILCHHAHFDGLILSRHYGIRPGYWFDTLSMANAVHGPGIAKDLAAMGVRYGVGVKGEEVIQAKGKRRADFTQAEWEQYGRYCLNDDDLTYGVFKAMLPQFSRIELEMMDITIRMFTEPVFELNEPLMREFLAWEKERKQELLDRIGADKSVLMSNDKFADLLRSMGVEPQMKATRRKQKDGTYKEAETYAFAKTDSFMQGLLESPDDELRWLAEARVAIKSTMNETRTERYLSCWSRGPMPVYLKYAAAHTLRWGGGDRMNWQNHQRVNKKKPYSGTIRKSILAPKGHKLCVADASQIEARVTGYLAGETWLVEAFAQRRDVYSEMASVFYGRHIDRKKNPEDEFPGFVGKVCIAEGSLVLTDRGIVPIEQVQLSDRVWDGEEWVCHEGVVCNGWKQTLELCGLWLTPDHLVWCGGKWEPALHLEQDESILSRALDIASENLPLQGIYSDQGTASLTPSSAAGAVGPSMPSVWKVSPPFGQVDATFARKRPQDRRSGGSTDMSCPMTPTGLDYSIAYPQPSPDAIANQTASMQTTGAEASSFTPRGGLTKRHFLSMSKRSPDGIVQSLRWTGQTSTGIMNQGIFGSSREKRTQQTNDGSKTWRKNSRVYDILSAGPRRRFTVLTAAGPLIVHNCVLGYGFGMGWYKAALNFLAGPMGADPVIFGEKEYEILQPNGNAFMANPKKVEMVRTMPSRLPMRERYIHCIVTEELVKRWRVKNKQISGWLWKHMERVLGWMNEGVEIDYGQCGFPVPIPLRVFRHGWQLQGFGAMHFNGLEYDGKEYSYINEKKVRTRLHGPVATENIVQYIARCATAESMVAYRQEYNVPIKMMAHDEVVSLPREEEAQIALAGKIRLMKRSPVWAPGLPLDAEGDIGDVYGEVK